MSKPYTPSELLLRAFLKPDSLPRCVLQVRHQSTYMPRHKYAAVTRLDKFHRTQKTAIREEKLQAIQRADAISVSHTASSPSSPITHPFSVTRTASSQLPVYETVKAGGSKHITTIRKLSGDLESLASQLRTVLNLPEHTIDQKGRKKISVGVNRTNGHVIVRGWRGEEVKAWMQAVGF